MKNIIFKQVKTFVNAVLYEEDGKLSTSHQSFGLSCSFTMAEILISLTIIGVIAAITLPSLIGNVNERVWDTQRRALHARMSQAIAMMPTVSGFGEYNATWHAGSCQPGSYCNDSVTIHNDNTAMTFINKGLSKVFELKNVCDHEHLSDCGLPDTIKKLDNTTFPMPTKLSELSEIFVKRYTKDHITGLAGAALPNNKGRDSYAAGIETINGESLLVLYNYQCMHSLDNEAVRSLIAAYKNESSWTGHQFYEFMQAQEAGNTWNYIFLQSMMCVNFIYDLNGKKGPNKIYKDMGYITVFYPHDSEVVAPIFTRLPRNPEDNQSYTMQQDLAARACTQMDKNSRVASLSELMAMSVNTNLHGRGLQQYAVAGWGGGDTVINEEYAWSAGEKHGWVRPFERTEELKVGCVKR